MPGNKEYEANSSMVEEINKCLATIKELLPENHAYSKVKLQEFSTMVKIYIKILPRGVHLTMRHRDKVLMEGMYLMGYMYDMRDSSGFKVTQLRTAVDSIICHIESNII